MTSPKSKRSTGFLLLILLGSILWTGVTGEVRAQQSAQSYTFRETGKTVAGRVLAYWSEHGGLALQGFPISEQIQETSDTDGKLYTVQYFERAVLELHPENQRPYDVLPSLLGVFRYKHKYPAGTPQEVANTEPGSRLFPETGKRAGGAFLAYWLESGGLVQHGYPISDEFTEVSDLNGQPYKVQYFERAVFEFHPENTEEHQVLLSQLGTFRYRTKYEPPPTTASTATAAPTVPASATPRIYGLVGQSGLGEALDIELLERQYAAGAKVRMLHLGWNVLQPDGPSSWNGDNAREFQKRIDAFADLAPDVKLVLELGLHYPPEWVRGIDPLVDQLGNRWNVRIPHGGVNAYWSRTVREHVAGYIARVFQNLDFKGRLWVVRAGVYNGELLYPEQYNGENGMSMWAFDEHAQSKSPVPGWKPGQPSPNGEAEKFYTWYTDNLVDTFNFLLGEIRHYYQGYVAPVTPGIGMNERSVAQLVSRNLIDNSLKTYGTGNYWQRTFALLPRADANVINWCSSLGDLSGNDASPDWWEWSSARLQAHYAHQNGREIVGENTGRNPYDASKGADPRTTARWIFGAVQSYNYIGLLWLSQASMADPNLTSLEQYRELVASHP